MIKTKKYFLIYPHAWLFFVFSIFLLFSPSQVICSDISEGMVLVNKLWSSLKERNMDEIYTRSSSFCL